jgi:tetratricopeptide (TPR) repeat protein
MSRRKQQKPDETLVDIVEVKEKAQDYFEHNQLQVLGILAIIVLGIGGVFLYNSLYKMPRNARGMEQMFQAQYQFERDSFALALDNPGGGYDGFLDIIDNYGGTEAANLASYYSAISYLHLGRYEAAKEFMESFKPSGDVTPIMKYGALGDIYSELGDMDKALSMYEKACNINENDYLTPYYLKKLGLLYEHQGNIEKSYAAFSLIKEKYPDISIARDIDKYIMRVKVD